MENYINIGTPTACLFVPMSKKLLKRLQKFPLLYDAVEEALISAKSNYYSIGIIVWYELLKTFLSANNKKDADKRNIPAHDILSVRPSKESYGLLLKRFKEEAEKWALKELAREADQEVYGHSLQEDWKKFMEELKTGR